MRVKLYLLLLLTGLMCSASAKTYDWQHPTIYKKPDFKKFFKKNSKATSALKALNRATEDQDNNDDKEIFKIVREGFYQADWKSRAQCLKWFGQKYARSGNQEAIEILYHILDPTIEGKKAIKARGAALYFGFSRYKEYTPNILRTFVDICMNDPESKREEQILKYSKPYYSEMIQYLKKTLRSRDKKLKEQAVRLKKIFKSEAPSPKSKRKSKKAQSPKKKSNNKALVSRTPKSKKGKGSKKNYKNSHRTDNFTYQEAVIGESKFMESFRELYNNLGQYSANVKNKNIDWDAVWNELSPELEKVKEKKAFGIICQKLVAKIQDSHAYLQDGTERAPLIDRWTTGFNCLKDSNGDAVIYSIIPGTDAQRAKLKRGMKIIRINELPTKDALEKRKSELSTYFGFSSKQGLENYALRCLGNSFQKNEVLVIEVEDNSGKMKKFKLKAQKSMSKSYIPRLPVKLRAIDDGGRNVQWRKMGKIGHIFVRRMNKDLTLGLNKALKALKKSKGIIIDVRANSGGGFSANKAFLNFNDKDASKKTIKCDKPLALVIGPSCASAGEGWASWFIANEKAKVFGSDTAGSSGRKRRYTLKNKMYKLQYVGKPYNGFLDHPIEGEGLHPDIEIYQRRQDIIDKKDTVLEAAHAFLTNPLEFDKFDFIKN